MEKFTNNRDEFINKIKSELLEYEKGEKWKEIFSYAELPYFLNYAWSYNWAINLTTSKYRLKRKEWNAAYDLSRFENGIYNLDRLAIRETEISMNTIEESYFHSINWNTINKVKFKGIVLDGLICEIRIADNKKSLRWNTDHEMNQELNKLIYTMRNWKREMKEL